MNTGGLSIHLDLSEFLSTMFCSFEYKFGISFVKFIPSYFILFDAFVDWIVYLVSFLDCSLQAYRSIIDFLYIDLLFCNVAEVIY